MDAETWKGLTIASDCIVAFCFVIMPGAIFSLFHHKRIGHVLDGWFTGLCAVFITCAIYRVLDIGAEFNPGLYGYQAIANLFTAFTSFTATVYLLWRCWLVQHHPGLVVNALRSALESQRVFLEAAHESTERR